MDKPNPVASALMAKMRIAPEDRAKVKLECLKMLVGLDLDPARNQLISGFVDTYLELNETEEKEFRTELDKVKPEEREGTMEIVTSWMREGIAKGELNIILRLLNRRVGPLSPELEQRVSQLKVGQLEELSEALLDFKVVSDLEDWLQSRAS